MKPIVLFILKRREDYDPDHHNHKGLSTGLFNSATFMEQMLNESGIEAHLEVAIDNNCMVNLRFLYWSAIVKALDIKATKAASILPRFNNSTVM